MERRLEEICREASELVSRGVNIIILSDRNLGPERAPMPSLLATAAVHHHLVREGTRLQIGLVVGDRRGARDPPPRLPDRLRRRRR